MPSCCPPTLIEYADALTLSIPYSDSLKAKYGAEPRVGIYFRNGAGQFQEAQGLPFFSTSFDGSNINIDFGGPQTGVIKIT